MTLSPRARRQEDEIELAIHERNARHVMELVESWGLARDQESPDEDVGSWFDRHDDVDAEARTVAEVWARTETRRR